MSILKVDNIGISFGGLRAVNNFSLEIKENELVGLIGPNGAGKTTVFNLLSGVYQPDCGNITLAGKSIIKKDTCNVVKSGIARTFQNIRLFSEMTVLENVMIGYHNQVNYSVFSTLLRLPKFRKQEKQMHEEALNFLKIFNLEQYADTKACNLPYGQQRKLEIARALACKPKLLLLDEPAAGMNPQETKELMETIALVRNKFKIAILLIEHDMKLVMGICEKICVLNYGSTLAYGNPEEILNNEAVIKAYLGD